MIVGRAFGCDVRLENPVVSNRHCTLAFDGQHWVVEDLGSRNGTQVNGVATTRQVVKPGDTIVVSAKFRFVIEYDPVVERRRFATADDGGSVRHGDDRRFLEHGPATKRLEPHDKDVWSQLER
jgi:pSer/pThr/pTyr-binding forkhead associated (FHA) protein